MNTRRVFTQMTREEIKNCAFTSKKVNIFMSDPHERILGGYVRSSSNDSVTVRLGKSEKPSEEDSVITVKFDDILCIECLEW